MLSKLPAEHATVAGTFGFQGWLSLVTLPESNRKEFPVTDTHLFTLPLHPLSVSLFKIFLILESPSSPVTCFTICSCRWCHPEKSESLVSPNPSWFSWSLSQSSRENKWETGKHISKHWTVTAHVRNILMFRNCLKWMLSTYLTLTILLNKIMSTTADHT